MTGVAIVGVDTAGGVHLGGGQALFTWNGKPIVVQGDRVQGHGAGVPSGAHAPSVSECPDHAEATMVEGSSLFRINGVPVVLAGHRASCGHVSTGQSNFTMSR